MNAAHLRLEAATNALEGFERLYASEPYAFLCESLGEAGRNRFSFLGGRPGLIHRSSPAEITIEHTATGETLLDGREFLDSLRAVLAQSEALPDIPPFSSGVIGYLAYDVVRRFERLPLSPPDPEGVPDSVFMVPSEIVVVDHALGVTDIVVHGAGGSSRASAIRGQLSGSDVASPPDRASGAPESVGLRSRTSRPAFISGVETMLEHIRAGDIFQGVLSQRFEADFDRDPLDLYRVLRGTNPSPYMYFLKLGPEHAVLGSSPEVLVSLEGRRAMTRPLAGTRPRGSSAELDEAQARDLRQDAKELAEHVMLVDLARNDLGRVCEYGSVNVTRRFEIERHARVMHLVSEVLGVLRDEYDALDLVRAAFPAGTVSGAPKIRAMEIIDALEPVRRGLYGGAIGYIDPAGRLDLCLAIRTIVVHRGRALLQAGAGVVADSDPTREYEETRHKASALVHALERCVGAAAANHGNVAKAEFTSAAARGSGGLSIESRSTFAAPQLKK